MRRFSVLFTVIAVILSLGGCSTMAPGHSYERSHDHDHDNSSGSSY